MATVYESKETRYGTVRIENGGYHTYALMVDGVQKASSNDWDTIKREYDSYN